MESKVKRKWCEHIATNGTHNQAVWVLTPINHFEVDDEQIEVSCDWDFCPICGTRRPLV